MRRGGIEVGLADEIDAAQALSIVPGSGRGELCSVLRAALKVRRRDWERFDAILDAFLARRAPTPRPHRESAGRSGPPGAAGEREGEGVAAGGSGRAGAGDPGYSPVALLRTRPPPACPDEDLADMERVLERLAARLAARRSRRLAPSRGRGAPDLRRSLRGALASGGELVRLARRLRAVEEPRLVFLCDTSGSMDAHTRFLLALVLALRRAAPATEVFAFNTSLVRITPFLSRGGFAAALERIAAAVPDWSGGTRIGDSLSQFVEDHLAARVDRRTVVVILSDGLDRGDPATLATAMRAIRERARRVVWLNPLLADPRYAPTARGMEAALPFVDAFLPAHDLASLERLLPQLAA
jgi:hypothetical protein